VKWFILLVGIVVICLVAAFLLGLISGGVGGATSSLRHQPLPDTPLTDDDLDSLQLDVTARGYRMSQVDGVLDRLRRELAERDEQIAVLRGDVQRAAPRTSAVGTGAAADEDGPAPAEPADQTWAPEPEPVGEGPRSNPPDA
jgi:DivIVA domain-containing protein